MPTGLEHSSAVSKRRERERERERKRKRERERGKKNQIFPSLVSRLGQRLGLILQRIRITYLARFKKDLCPK